MGLDALMSIGVSLASGLGTVGSVIWGMGVLRGRIEGKLDTLAADVSDIKAGRVATCVQHAEQIAQIHRDLERLLGRRPFIPPHAMDD